MKASSLIGVALACLLIAVGATMEGSNIMAVLNPSAILIVLGGTLGATMAGTSFATFKNIPVLYKKAFLTEPPDMVGRGAPSRRSRRARARGRPCPAAR